MPASCETSMKNASEAANIPVTSVLLTGTWVRLWTLEKNDGNNPSLAIAMSILGCTKKARDNII